MGFIYNEENWREIEITKVIATYPEIRHNALKKIIVENEGLMEPVTFRKTMKNLIEKKKIIPFKDGNKIIYDIPTNSIFEPSNEMTNQFLDELEVASKNFARIYPDISEDKQIRHAILLANTILTTRNFFDLVNITFMKTCTKSKIKYRRQIRGKVDKLLENIFEIINKEPNGESIKHVVILSSIYTTLDFNNFKLVLNEQITEMTDLLKEKISDTNKGIVFKDAKGNVLNWQNLDDIKKIPMDKNQKV